MVLYSYKSTLVSDKPTDPDIHQTYGEGRGLVLPKVDSTVNGVPIELRLDTGTGLTSITPDDAHKANLYPLKIIGYQDIQTANGKTRGPMVITNLSLNGSREFEAAIMVDEHLPFSIVSMTDVIKVLSVNFTPDGVEFTPLSRPFKQQQEHVKKSRLGWSSGWI